MMTSLVRNDNGISSLTWYMNVRTHLPSTSQAPSVT